jgi:hypothetical protein
LEKLSRIEKRQREQDKCTYSTGQDLLCFVNVGRGIRYGNVEEYLLRMVAESKGDFWNVTTDRL